MRAHGVPNFPDPRRGPSGSMGMTVLMSPGSSTVTVQGVGFSGPIFDAAKKTCGFMSGGGPEPPQASESYKLAAIAFARCMRARGVPNFPDPTFSEGGGVMGGDAPGIDRNAPAVQRASRLCSHP
jgi:hypothetical protein